MATGKDRYEDFHKGDFSRNSIRNFQFIPGKVHVHLISGKVLYVTNGFCLQPIPAYQIPELCPLVPIRMLADILFVKGLDSYALAAQALGIVRQ